MNIDSVAMEQLISILHGVHDARSMLDKVLSKNSVLSLEIVSTRKKGIRYMIGVRENEVEFLKQSIFSYSPDIVCREVSDYLPRNLDLKQSAFLSLRQTGHFAYPLQPKRMLQKHDPIGYLTGLMTKLDNEDLVALQVMVTPIVSFNARRINKKILDGREFRSTLGLKKKLMNLVKRAIFLIILPFIFIPWIILGFFTTKRSSTGDLYISPAEQSLLDSMHTKLGENHFRTSINAIVVSRNRSTLKERTNSLKVTFSTYTSPQHQSLVSRSNFPTVIKSRYRRAIFVHRLPSLLSINSNLLSTSEIASMYHFPDSKSAKTENVVRSLSKTLPAPVSLKNGTHLDIILGDNIHHGRHTQIGLTDQERQRHVYMIGGTGSGKTTMMLYSIMQDIQKGKGVAVIDPHGDLAQTILHHIPRERMGDVIYLNPDDLSYPIGINLLELTPGLEGDDLLREKDLITESTISVLRKIFSNDDSGGHRIEYVLRNAIQTALTLEGSTLFTIFRLLNDNVYRREVTRSLQDEDLKNFWKNELGKAGDFQKVKMVAGITAKIGRFLFSASAKRIMEQEKSTIDFSEVLDSGKILICNFSKGLLGEDTSTLFGTTILAKLQVAALRRARQAEGSRRSFYLYVDEFQNFATMSFVQMLSEARKYKLFLTMAEQSTSQQEQQRLVDIILANVGTVICFRSGSPADERYVLPLFYPYVEQGEIANLPAYNFYMRIAAVQAEEPLSGQTVLLDEPGDEAVFENVVATSRKTYGKKVVTETIQKTKGSIPLKSSVTAQCSIESSVRNRAPSA